jgi:hypothetical protein
MKRPNPVISSAVERSQEPTQLLHEGIFPLSGRCGLVEMMLMTFHSSALPLKITFVRFVQSSLQYEATPRQAGRRCFTSSSCLSRRSLDVDGRYNLQRQSTKDDKIRDFSTSVEMTLNVFYFFPHSILTNRTSSSANSK